MKLEELKTIEQLTQFLNGTRAVIFTINSTKNELVRFLNTCRSAEKVAVITKIFQKTSFIFDV